MIPANEPVGLQDEAAKHAANAEGHKELQQMI